MTSTRDRVPAHLRQYVVDQDYDAYDEIDQAVWRFVLLQTYDRLQHTAHPAYVEGLARTGISVDRIPRIEEMDDCLSEYGWGAVVVDGFIPPRAFQEFQALGIMTIAAAIRRRRHLAYTPAPDIIHESAGHAPIVPDPVYRGYLQRFGEIGKKAFASQEDLAVYNAIRELSEVKEDRESTPAQIEAAQRALDEAQAGVTTLTEAALLSRLHWWTVEYGLVGSVDDYKIYGAGLLSSLGESTHCHRSAVKKIPLDVSCVEVGYDITRPQPQLFVARDFDQLNQVLDEFANTLAQRRGGHFALEVMQRSGELGTIVLNGGTQITGVLEEIVESEGAVAWLRLSGPCAIAQAGTMLSGQEQEHHPEGFSFGFGLLEGGVELSALSEEELLTMRDGERLRLRYESSVEVEGRLGRTQSDESGHLLVITLEDAHARLGDRVLFQPEWGSFDLPVGEEVVSCFAGAADVAFYPATDFTHKSIPRAKDSETAAEEGKVLHLYHEALALWNQSQRPELSEGFRQLDEKLRAHPDEWLLRWNLLECLRKVDEASELQKRLRDELLEIEKTDPETLPITTGLRYLEMV